MKPASPLPHSVCLRISRTCNANCRFCLAPSDGSSVDLATLKHRVDWLLQRGVRRIHFCGGEPSIHPDLPGLLFHAHFRNVTTRITTNGIELSEPVFAAFRATRPHVKVSLHGDRDHHNRIVGGETFDRTVCNLQRLLRAGVKASVQTTVIAEAPWVPEWMVEFCLQNEIKRLTLIPFLPRGAGAKTRGEFELSARQRSVLQNQVKQRRKLLGNRLDLRWLDLTASPLCVVDIDGRIAFERGSEASDEVICTISPPRGSLNHLLADRQHSHNCPSPTNFTSPDCIA